MAYSQTERLLKSKQHQYVNEHTVCKWAHLCRKEPRLTVYRVVLTFVQQNGLYFTSSWLCLECPTYAFSDTPIPIFNDKCYGLPFLLTV